MNNRLIYSTGIRWAWIIAIVLTLDYVSKQWVLDQLVPGQTKSLAPWLNLLYARNYGAAFGLLAEQGGWQRWIFTGMGIIIIAVLLIMMYHTSAQKKLNNIAYSFLIGGTLGNLIDRCWQGFVIDFIDFYIKTWHYPTFNVADTFICLGAAMMAIENFLSPSK